MKIQQLDLTVRDLVAGYRDDGDGDGGADTDFADKLSRFYVNGNRKYARIVIRRKEQGNRIKIESL